MSTFDYKGRLLTDPGAPMAPVIGGMDRSALGELNWANQFRRHDNQLSALPTPVTGQTAATAPLPTSGAGTITSQVLSEIMGRVGNAPISLNTPGVFTGQAPANGPISLTQLAQTGVNHANDWMQRASQGRTQVQPWRPPGSDIATNYGPKQWEPQQEDLAGKNMTWGSAFR